MLYRGILNNLEKFIIYTFFFEKNLALFENHKNWVTS